MGYSKVIYGGQTLIDLTNDSVKAHNLLEGEIAHDASGEPIVGNVKKFTETYDGTLNHITFECLAGYDQNGDVIVGEGGGVTPPSGGEESVDLSAATVTPSTMLLNVTAYKQGVDGKPELVTGAIPTKDASTIIPTESRQTISANQYLAGVQTIEAIPSDYVGSAVPVSTIHQGSTNPSDILGADGDIYLKV